MKSKNKRKQSKRTVIAVKYDPRLPSLTNIMAKHWRSMISQDQYLSECFPETPLTAFKRPKNLRELIIKAKVPPPQNMRPQREIRGMRKCGTTCTACPYIKEDKKIKIDQQNTWNLYRKHTCNSFNIIYMLECNLDKCKLRYIGESKRSVKHRLADHRGYIINQHVDKATGAHFNTPGHSLANLTCTVLEQVRYNNKLQKRERKMVH